VISRPLAQSDSATFFGGGVIEKDVVPGKEVPFGGRETKLEHVTGCCVSEP